MEHLELDDKRHIIIWKIDIKQAQENELGWRMLENNRLEGIFPFDYYYVDNSICFCYPYESMQKIGDYFQKKKGNFEVLFLLCEGVLKIVEQGQEYLLDSRGYLIVPEWIFWNRYEKKISICYLPGKKEEIEKEYTTLVEYLMEHTDHTDKKAVKFIYGLYDMITSENFVLESILGYLREYSDKAAMDDMADEKTEEIRRERSVSKEIHRQIPGVSYSLSKISDDKEGKIYQKLLYSKENRKCLIDREEIVVGRSTESDMYLPFCVVSRRHALIFLENSSVYVMDTASKNGTYINGSKISAYVKTECKESDVITFADISYRLDKNDSC